MTSTSSRSMCSRCAYVTVLLDPSPCLRGTRLKCHTHSTLSAYPPRTANLHSMHDFQLLRIFPGDVDTDGDGVIDEQEIRIKYLNRELFVETVMNDGDRVRLVSYLCP
jgi:hypothetical protein